MLRKTALFCACLMLTGIFGGCSTTDDPASEPAPEVTLTLSGDLCYITGNGTTDAAKLTSFREQLDTDGFTWTESTLMDIPADADALILNAPTEDLTKDELNALNDYMSTGGHLLLLLPAYESDTHYKYLSQFLEPYCLYFDYDRISETDAARMQNEDKYCIQTDYITRPDNMPLYSAAQDSGIVRFNDARSFHFVYQDHFSSVKQDVILKTAASVIGEPFGGIEDDPLTYEETALDVMGFARNENMNNASVVYVGAADFLHDGAYSADNAAAAWVHSALQWFMIYQ